MLFSHRIKNWFSIHFSWHCSPYLLCVFRVNIVVRRATQPRQKGDQGFFIPCGIERVNFLQPSNYCKDSMVVLLYLSSCHVSMHRWATFILIFQLLIDIQKKIKVWTQDLCAQSLRNCALLKLPGDFASRISVVSIVVSVRVPDHSWSVNRTAWLP